MCGIGAMYPGLPEVAYVFGCSAAHFADVHPARGTNCSLTMAELNPETLQHAVALCSGEGERGFEPFAVDWCVYAEGGWRRWSYFHLG